MKIVVFGGSGFLGSHVVDYLLSVGHEVKVFDLKPSPYFSDKKNMVIGDILDEQAVDCVVKGAEAVYNFAGIADIDKAMVNPLTTVTQNIIGNTIILDACQRNSVRKFLFASSVYVYSNSGSFYRTSKRACELIIEDYHKTYGLDFAILRYGSLYGARADERNWIYSILKQALTEGRIVRQGDGEEVREYIHVHDAAKASVDLLKNEYDNQYVIISGNQAIKIKDLLMMIKEILNNKVKIEYVLATDAEHYEVTPYSFSPKIAKKIIGSTYLDLGQGILDMLSEIYAKVSMSKECNGVYSK